jgi:DNA-binding GntR family transcriptional regulator
MVSRPEAPPVAVHQHLSKSAFAYHELRRRVLDGDLEPGRRLLLRPLAEELGLSVMPVRDALRLLERDGLVASETHRGATVTQISADAVIEAIGIRMWLEVLAVREAVPRHDAATLAEARRRLDAARDAIDGDDGLAYARANRRLHEALEAPASQAVRDLVAELWERLWQARRRMSLFSLLPAVREDAQREHEELHDAVARGDAEGAAAAMERHRASSLAAWRDAMRELPAVGGDVDLGTGPSSLEPGQER